ncbi:iron complex outermembrane receptor protein [Sphingobium sp. OAS761]|uniref:TonB-dependent receptor n=1 Tax=Sphingobium sp. OAS761 TaxID=2817901 RepID=UPI00209E1273|nr:TonB-dependent receptor [Sphingobium sp. OAS761]MCP1471478.1 iron complex outermembrane receptor protein [Sphingobium sp. OAS761]
MKVIIGAALAIGLSGGGIAHAQDNEAQDDGTRLQEIVVTAQRRTENIQNVPISVTALSADTLDNARVTDIRNLSGLAPNVLINSQGISSIPTVTIRGIQSGVSSSSVDPKVGIYLDGVYIGRTVGAIFDLADIERVETLRGPQGTLFGRNATAGAISIVTPNPTGKLEGNALLSAGNYDSFRGRLSLNLPSFGIFSARISYLHDEFAGDTPNLLAGKSINFDLREPGIGTLPYAKRLGAKNVDAVQIAVRAEFSPDFDLTYRFDYTDSETVGRPAQTAGFNADSTGALAGGINAFQGLTGGTLNLSRSRLDAVANASSVQPLKVEGHSLIANWDLGTLKLKNIAAYRRFKQDWNTFDLASTGGQKFTAAQLGALLAGDVAGVTAPGVQPGPNDYLFDLLTARTAKQHQFSDELQMLVSTEAFDLTTGLFYFREKGAETNVLGIFQPVANGQVLPTPLDAVFGSGVNQAEAINEAYAAYAQGTYHVTPQIDLTLGGRYTTDRRKTNVIRRSGTAAGGSLGVGTYTETFHKFTYAAILGYRPTDDINAYAKVSSGYVAGGIADGSPYGPESLTSYELGLKTELFDRRLRANFAVYYSDYKDLQIQQFLGGRQIFSNAGRARTYGAEAELEARPARGLMLAANLGYQKFDYRRYILNGVDVADRARALYAPKITAKLSGRYEVEADFGRPFISMDARYRSRSYHTLLPSTNPVTERGTYQTPFWLVDGRIGVDDIRIGGTEFALSVWAQNLFDKDAYTFGPTVINQNVFYDQSRTYGIELKAKF